MWGCGVLPTTLPAPFSATLSLALSVYLRECGAAGYASGQTACPICPTLCQSRSRHGHTSPLRPGCPSPPLLPVWMNVYFLFPWCRTSLPFDFLSFWLWEEVQCVYLHRHLGSHLYNILEITKPSRWRIESWLPGVSDGVVGNEWV